MTDRAFKAASTFEVLGEHQKHATVSPALLAAWAQRIALWADSLPENAEVWLVIDWTMESVDGFKATWEIP